MLARRRLFTVILTGVFVFSGVAASQAVYTPAKPKAGAWKFQDIAGGFSLKPGHGSKRNRLFLTKVRTKTGNFTGCPAKPKRITVAGRFALRPLRFAGSDPTYRPWGVGRTGMEKRYNDGELGIVSVRAKVRVGGKLAPRGGIKMSFQPFEANSLLTFIIEFGPKGEAPCVTYSQYAVHR